MGPSLVRLPILIAVLGLSAFPAAAIEDASEARRYTECMETVLRNPDGAFENALAWSYEGGGFPARHCAASALLALEHYAEAAIRLEQMAEDMTGSEAQLRPDVLRQAGRAWLLQGDLERALADFTTAIKIAPRDPLLLKDRGTVLALAGLYWEAIDDLNLILETDPDDVDALIMRAGAYRFLESGELAMEDVERALTIDPDNVDALAERGNLRRLMGDDQGAHDDWVRVLQIAPDSPAADASRANIEKLDVKIEE